MTRKKFFPRDWLGNRPYKTVGEADIYYSGIASMVYDLLEAGGMEKEVFKTTEKTVRAAAVLTGLFEDIISGTGMWDLVVSECLRRYGKMLPFYDMTDYVRGEINLQDVQLLLWDLVQAQNPGRVMNPENPMLQAVSSSVFLLLDAEYEFAVENEPLKAFLTDPAIDGDYWAVRHRLEWILQSSFLNHRFIGELPDILKGLEESDVAQQMGMGKAAYYHQVDALFNFRDNLLSMRCPEILSAICGLDEDGIIAGMRLLPTFTYEYLDNDDRLLTLSRVVDGKVFHVEMDSFGTLDTSPFRKGVTAVNCTLVNYGSKTYQIGLMSVQPEGAKLSDRERSEQYAEVTEKFPAEMAKKLKKAMKGREIVFFSSFKTLKNFVEATTGFDIGPDQSAGYNPEGHYMLTLDSKYGISISGGFNHCICLPDNTFYDKERAGNDAVNFFVNPRACNYDTACMLQDADALPDAYLESTRGREHGRAFLHENGWFFTDYFFHRYRGDE